MNKEELRQKQLKQIRSALTNGGFTLGYETKTIGGVNIHGRVGTMEIRVNCGGLGTYSASGVVSAFRYTDRGPELGKTLARFFITNHGIRMQNYILELTLDRMDPFGK